MSKNSAPLKPYSYIKQIRTVTFVITSLVFLGGIFAYSVLDEVCNASLSSCFSDPTGIKPIKYLLLGLIRPFILVPSTLFSIMGAKAFGDIGSGGFAGIIIMSAGNCLSFITLYGVAKLVGKRLVNPWLSSNLPQTFKFVRSQDWKIAIVSRLVPFIPFDFLSLVYGLIDFRFKHTLLVTFLVSIPENYLLIGLVDKDTSVATSLFTSMGLVTVAFIIPGIVFEWVMRKKGSGLIRRLTAMWNEIMYELRLNNDIIKRHSFIESKTPVLLLYGFFSSRRALSVMERLLKQRGYEVLSFNLGGLFGVFFTRGIIETAKFINYKLMRQFERNGFEKIHIVAHSKGGLVALWWLLRLGGHRYCDKVITMGTPYTGSKYTWLALVTPLGLWWKDVWQMRPGSTFLKAISSLDIPKHMQVFCFHSNKDKVATGTNAVLKPLSEVEGTITPVPMNHISHFEFLYKRDVADRIASILGEPDSVDFDDSNNSSSGQLKFESGAFTKTVNATNEQNEEKNKNIDEDDDGSDSNPNDIDNVS
jgi:uncharacterized membrane protein YdjX (TVP38/TMEM64 family)